MVSKRMRENKQVRSIEPYNDNIVQYITNLGILFHTIIIEFMTMW